MTGPDFDPSRLTALVIDDSAFQRGLSCEQLRGMGFKRVVGADTASAWDRLCETRPDVVLMEWFSGDSDGLDFVRRVRTSSDAPDRAVPIFMLTSRGKLDDVETARKAGADGYLRKPISALALGKRVRRVVANPQPFVVTESYIGPCRRRNETSDYGGPWRRLSDTPPDAMAEGDEGVDNVKAELARARVTVLQNAARRLDPNDRNTARALYRAAEELLATAKQIDDPTLALGAAEMARYLQALGATERLSREVVETHVAALYQLASLPAGMVIERERVARGLTAMIDKKLRQASAQRAS